MNCIKCKQPIPQARLDALPGTKTCVNCSSTERVAGFMPTDHKMSGSIQIMDQKQAEVMYKLSSRPGYAVNRGTRFKTQKTGWM